MASKAWVARRAQSGHRQARVGRWSGGIGGGSPTCTGEARWRARAYDFCSWHLVLRSSLALFHTAAKRCRETLPGQALCSRGALSPWLTQSCLGTNKRMRGLQVSPVSWVPFEISTIAESFISCSSLFVYQERGAFITQTYMKNANLFWAKLVFICSATNNLL